MKANKLRGVRIWNIIPCDSGFGEWESNGATFVRKDSIKLNPNLDGLIKNQTGPAVIAETWDRIEVRGMISGWSKEVAV